MGFTLAGVAAFRYPRQAQRLAFPLLLAVLLLAYFQGGFPLLELALRRFLILWALGWAVNLLFAAFWGAPRTKAENSEWAGVLGAALSPGDAAAAFFLALAATVFLAAVFRPGQPPPFAPFLLLGAGAALAF
ncbi:MAG: hypothetical protein KM310_06865 [Clostridiales bacterium]|nr:hypothetical protein [Clostridiales bacterium]